MQPIKEFEKYYKLSKKDFLIYTKNKNYNYIHNTSNFYNNTTHSLSAFFYFAMSEIKRRHRRFHPFEYW